MVGAGLFLTAITIVRPWALGVVALGAAVGIPALRRIVPEGTFRAAPGRPAAAASAFLLSAGFLAMDAFLTLMLTDVRGLTLGQASVAITAASVAWALGSLWQSGRADRVALPRLLRVGTLLVLVGQVAVTATLVQSVPLVWAFAGWALVGVGMGISFPTIPLATMRASEAGEESGQLSSVLLLDFLGVAAGAGLAGGAVATSEAFGEPLAWGIAGAFAIGLAALLVLLWTAGRIPDRLPDDPPLPTP
jgi:predicted MFS family arabinose efflux permease